MIIRCTPLVSGSREDHIHRRRSSPEFVHTLTSVGFPAPGHARMPIVDPVTDGRAFVARSVECEYDLKGTVNSPHLAAAQPAGEVS
jgi:hypothetical protein